MPLGEIKDSVNYPLVVHFHKVALTNFLVVGYESFAVSAANGKDVATTDFFAVWVWIYGHGGISFILLLAAS